MSRKCGKNVFLHQKQIHDNFFSKLKYEFPSKTTILPETNKDPLINNKEEAIVLINSDDLIEENNVKSGRRKKRRKRKQKNKDVINEEGFNFPIIPSNNTSNENKSPLKSKNFPSPNSTGSLTQTLFQNKKFKGNHSVNTSFKSFLPISLSNETASSISLPNPNIETSSRVNEKKPKEVHSLIPIIDVKSSSDTTSEASLSTIQSQCTLQSLSSPNKRCDHNDNDRVRPLSPSSNQHKVLEKNELNVIFSSLKAAEVNDPTRSGEDKNYVKKGRMGNKRKRKLVNEDVINEEGFNSPIIPSNNTSNENKSPLKSKNFPSPNSTGSLTQTLFQNKKFKGNHSVNTSFKSLLPISLSNETASSISLPNPNINTSSRVNEKKPEEVHSLIPIIDVKSSPDTISEASLSILNDANPLNENIQSQCTLQSLSSPNKSCPHNDNDRIRSLSPSSNQHKVLEKNELNVIFSSLKAAEVNDPTRSGEDKNYVKKGRMGNKRKRKLVNEDVINEEGFNSPIIPSNNTSNENKSPLKSKNFPSPNSTGSLTQTLFQNKKFKGNHSVNTSFKSLLPISLSNETASSISLPNPNIETSSRVNEKKPKEVHSLIPIIDVKSSSDTTSEASLSTLNDANLLNENIQSQCTLQSLSSPNKRCDHNDNDRVRPLSPLSNQHKVLEENELNAIFSSLKTVEAKVPRRGGEDEKEDSRLSPNHVSAQPFTRLSDTMLSECSSDSDSKCSSKSNEYLTENSKLCLEDITRVLVCYYNLDLKRCISIMERNSFNILSTLQELQEAKHSSQNSV